MEHASPERSEATPAAERQRRREGLIILCTALAVLFFAFFETRLPQFSSGNSLSNNVIFFLLINLNIILLVLLVFLVARNLLKLVFERRRRMLGSHLRTRLVLAFLAVSIFPAILIFLVAILPQFVDPALPVGAQMVWLAAGSMIPEFFILAAYGWLGSRAANLAADERYAAWTDRAAGALVLVVAGLILSVGPA